MKNQVQLITYVDRLSGGGLQDLTALVVDAAGPLSGLFGGVHLLPFFDPIDGSDAGFDPIDHTQVDPRLGDWNDVKALAAHMDVVGDVIVNHISSRSRQFLDYVQHGARSRYAGMFLSFGSVFPTGAKEEDLLAIYRPRPGMPFTSVTLANGQKQFLWTTFTAQQVDIDVLHPNGSAYLDGILSIFAANGIRMIRLDAAGYAIKKAGTSCFMLPQTFDFIAAFASRAKAAGIEVLVEVHSYFGRQIEIARRVDWVYDFALPPLVLHALFNGTALPLRRWIGMRPTNALTVLDTHDGIGIIDVGADTSVPARERAACPGLVAPDELDAMVATIHHNSGGTSRQATGAAASNLDLYQVNCTFYDALGRDDRAYLVARAIQFFLPGVPQVYYVGLLAGENDTALLERTGVGRDINRHQYDRVEIDTALRRPVVQDLFDMIRLRNSHPAFGGRFELQGGDDDQLAMRWCLDRTWIALTVGLAARALRIEGDDGSGPRRYAWRC